MTAASEQATYLPAPRSSFFPESWEFLRWEIRPYPGRAGTVARMVITAALVMVLVMTFRIPNGTLATYFSLLLARENLAATWRQSVTIVLGFVAGAAYTLVSMMLCRGSTTIHFFWVIGSLFLVFFVMRTATNYGAAAGFSILIATTLPLWDQPLRSEAQVAATLWQSGAIAVGAGVTVAVEAVYRLFDRSDPLITSLNDLLLTTQQVLDAIAKRRVAQHALRDKLQQHEATGTGRLRMTLSRQGVDATRRAYLGAMIFLVGRLTELAANFYRGPILVSDEDSGRMQKLCERIEEVRNALGQSLASNAPQKLFEQQPSADVPFLPEMERTVDLLWDVTHRGISENGFQHREDPSGHSLFVPDAFRNPEYLRFALAGCIASSVCYMIYNGLDWQGISTSVLTCIVTALSTIGTSVQQQVLRLAGFVVGGLLIGIPAQILILPNLDTIFGFTLFFAAVTALAVWFATCSPRLSYFGLQIALALYFINLLDFGVQTDLTLARDRVIGVLLGILAMGLIFDRFGTRSDAEEMWKQFSRISGMLARFGFVAAERDRAAAMPEIRELRSQINDNFAALGTQMDSVRFEFGYGPDHDRNIRERENVRRAEPALRSIYLLELSLMRYRASIESASALSQEQEEALALFLRRFSSSLADAAEAKPVLQGSPTPITDSAQRLRRAFEDRSSAYSAAMLDICARMLASLRLLTDTTRTVET